MLQIKKACLFRYFVWILFFFMFREMGNFISLWYQTKYLFKFLMKIQRYSDSLVDETLFSHSKGSFLVQKVLAWCIIGEKLSNIENSIISGGRLAKTMWMIKNDWFQMAKRFHDHHIPHQNKNKRFWSKYMYVFTSPF